MFSIDVPQTRSNRWAEVAQPAQLDGDNSMIDDIAEGIAKTIFRGTLRFIFGILIEAVFFYTGEIVLFILTFGRKKPRWDYYADVSAPKWVLFTEISTWIGIAFWVVIVWLIKMLFFS